MITKTMSDIRTEIITDLSTRLPNIDITEGTPERDIFVEAPIGGQLTSIWDQIIYTSKLFAPLIYYTELTDEDITAHTANFNVTPRSATYSTGTVVFYKNSLPTADAIISDGTQVSTESGAPIVFIVQGSYTLYAAIASSYYNATTLRWEITCNVQAQNAGPNYRAGSNTITRIINTIPNIDGCTNTNSVTGGLIAETSSEALRRTVSKFQGRGLSSTQGIQSYVSNSVSAVNIVGSNDPDMYRDEGLGGAVDIYVIGSTLTTVIDSVTITSTGLQNPLTVSYTSTGITLAYQPVHQINSLSINSVIQSPTTYKLVLDTGVLSKSTRALDKIQFTSTGYFSIGDKVEINYLYNRLLKSIEDDLNSPANHFMNRDYLLREMTAVTINTYMHFKEKAGQDFNVVANSVEINIATFINSILTAGSLEKADVLGVAKAMPAVDNIDLTTFTITPVGGGTVTAQGDILLNKNEYPTSGTITLVRWTS